MTIFERFTVLSNAINPDPSRFEFRTTVLGDKMSNSETPKGQNVEETNVERHIWRGASTHERLLYA